MNRARQFLEYNSQGWIGVDLDGTLAHYDSGYSSHFMVGPPIPAMLARVKDWLAQGKDVRIFTARVAPPHSEEVIARQRGIIEDWCLEHLGTVLPITATKDYEMLELWDDRCVTVEKNTGRCLTLLRGEIEGLQ